MIRIMISVFLLLAGTFLFAAEPLPPVRLNLQKNPSSETVFLKPGQMLELALDSNPTTGYDWQVFLPETEVLLRKPGEYRPSHPGTCGSGGVQIMRFEGKKPGRTRLIGCYYRNWEKPDLQKEQTFVLTVEVRPADGRAASPDL